MRVVNAAEMQGNRVQIGSLLEYDDIGVVNILSACLKRRDL
jgi:hypothetical protein